MSTTEFTPDEAPAPDAQNPENSAFIETPISPQLPVQITPTTSHVMPEITTYSSISRVLGLDLLAAISAEL